MCSIYKITNIVSGKVYIGQTPKPFTVRWHYHYNQFLNKNNKLPLYVDMRTIGIEKFSFQIIEYDVDEIELDAKEEYYINIYHSNMKEYGYNQTLGGKHTINSYLSEDVIRQIIHDIINNPDMSLTEIGKMHNINVGLISDINQGDTWNFSEYTYPIRLSHDRANKLNTTDINEIVNLLMQGKSCKTIAKMYNVSNVTISNINNGKIYKNKDISYPICKSTNSRERLTIRDVQDIVNYLSNTDLSYSQIGNIVCRDHHTISNIDAGRAYKNLLNQLGILNFPIRKL